MSHSLVASRTASNVHSGPCGHSLQIVLAAIAENLRQLAELVTPAAAVGYPPCIRLDKNQGH